MGVIKKKMPTFCQSPDFAGENQKANNSHPVMFSEWSLINKLHLEMFAHILTSLTLHRAKLK